MDTMETTCGLVTQVTFQGKVKIRLTCLAVWFEALGYSGGAHPQQPFSGQL